MFNQQLEISIAEWNGTRLAAEAADDVLELEKYLTSVMKDQNKSLEDILSRLNIVSTQFENTLLLLQPDHLDSSTFSKQMIDVLKQIHDVILRTSNREATKSGICAHIPENEIRIIQSEPVRVGSSSQIFLGVHHGNLVAIKGSKDLISSEETLEKLADGTGVWYTLNHRNVMPLVGANLELDRPYLVMPFMEFGSLFHYLKQNETTLEDKVRFMVDIAFGMEYIHKCGIIHGTLKPESILIGINY